MADISIDLVPDPEQDTAARRAALALVTAMHADAQDDGLADVSAVALNDLLGRVVSGIGEVREESVPALTSMLNLVGRQYTAFGAVTSAAIAAAFAAGQRDPQAAEPDYEAVLRAAGQVIEQFEDGTG